MPDSHQPRATFVLIAFNQEDFVKDAVEGALSQDYPDLEIILSDDCSTDRTFEVMQDAVAAYTGPHQIKLNRNSSNLGIGKHINRVMELAEGELVIGAAGDDISLPHRTSRLVDVWIENQCADVSIYSAYEIIDSEGVSTGVASFEAEHQKNDSLRRILEQVRIVGPSHCWSTNLFREFGGIDFGAVNEDSIIQFRASLRGGVIVVPDILVKYRLHPSNISNLETENAHVSALQRRANTSLTQHRRGLARLKNYQKDLERAAAQNGLPYTAERKTVQQRIATWALRVSFAVGDLGTRIRCILRAMRERYGWPEVSRMLLRVFMPRAI